MTAAAAVAEAAAVAAAAGLMPRVWEGVGKGVTGDAPTNPERRGYRGVGVRRI